MDLDKGTILIKSELQDEEKGPLFNACTEYQHLAEVEVKHEAENTIFLSESISSEIVVKEEFVDRKDSQLIASVSDSNTATDVEILKGSHCNFRKQNNIKRFKCKRCDYVTKSEAFLAKHVSFGRCLIEFQCNICEFVKKSKSNLKTHMTSHSSLKFKCRLCPFTTKYKGVLKRHLSHLHGSNVFKCVQCRYVTKCDSNLKCHVSVQHGLSEFSCHHCKFVTKYKGNLVLHLTNRHGVSGYNCTQCPYGTRSKRSLVSHVRIHHRSKPSSDSDEGVSFKCHLCEYETKYESNIRYHTSICDGKYKFGLVQSKSQACLVGHIRNRLKVIMNSQMNGSI